MDEPATLEHIGRLLVGGLVTQHAKRAYTSEQVNTVTARLQTLASDDLAGRLVVAGFTDKPFVAPGDADGIEQSCATCMYFERHRGWCNLAELMLPVRAEWSCILWRI